MNEILRDPKWWNAARRSDAELRFDPNVVAAFFDELQAGVAQPEELRERTLPLPTVGSGYSRVLFVGTTGAGKTTLLRQLIGSDPDEDRFPSTAPAKTTIADIEVIAADGPYEAIVTFFSEFQVQAYVEESVIYAALAFHTGSGMPKAADRFLNHPDQRFRLSYILGPWNDETVTDEDVDDLFGDSGDAILSPSTEDALPDAERRENKDQLVSIISRIENLARDVSAQVTDQLGLDSEPLAKEDADAFMELLEEVFEQQLHSQETFHDLVQDILETIGRRFDLLELGELHRGRSGWPESWAYKGTNRSEFIRQIRWFSSNYWPHFGRLLTPIVNGMRVRGPLYSEIYPEGRKLVLIDGQGLGHTPDEATSVTTHITSKFADVDVILLVDNAQQPMQAAPLSVLRALAVSGYDDKLSIAFTHFDQIKGQNLRSMEDRRSHVMASVTSALSSLQDTVGTRIVRRLERDISERSFMLGSTHKRLSVLNPRTQSYMVEQLKSLVDFFAKAAVPRDVPSFELVYDATSIPFAVQDGVNKFSRSWKARLGLVTASNVRKEHWTRIRALNKRVAGELAIEYDTLRPVADLQTALLEAISRYLDKPVAENGVDVDQPASARIRQLVAAKLTLLVKERLVSKPLEQWRILYLDRGPGSAYRRTLGIAALFDQAAPLPGAVMTPNGRAFLDEVVASVTGSVIKVGGRVQSTPEGLRSDEER